MSGQKPAANRSTMMVFKAKVVGAKKGHGLLKKKRDALKSRFQEMLKEIINCKLAVGKIITESAFSLAKVQWAGEGEIGAAVQSRVNKASITTGIRAENCAGVQMPTFKMQRDVAKEASMDSLGIGCGGQVIQTCREQNVLSLELLIRMASLQTSFKVLDEEIKMTSRRVNALEYVVMPKLEEIVAYIKQEMDEMEREEFFRVKKIVEKKKQRKENEKAELAKEAAAAASAVKTGSKPRLGQLQVGQIGVPGQSFGQAQLGQAINTGSIGGKDKDLLF